MWCKHCNIETNETLCPVCGNATVEDLPTKFIGVAIVEHLFCSMLIRLMRAIAQFVREKQNI